MKICPICHSQNADESYYCTMCGNRLPDETENKPVQAPVYQPNYQNVYQQPVPAYDPYDHTAEFDAADVGSNKLFAISMYLLSFIGIIIALLGAKESAYVQFHLRQNLKFMIVETLLGLCAGILFFTFIVPIAAVICIAVIEVIRIITFFQVCGGKSREPAIIRSLGFLK